LEDIAAYIILFSFGLGALYLYQSRRNKPREMPYSVQPYPECILKVLVTKLTGKIKSITLKVIARKDLILNDVKIELIDKNREFSHLQINSKVFNLTFPLAISQGKLIELEIPFEDFKAALLEQEKTFQTFRITAETESGKKFKTHELTFNKNWTIYKPDTGKYN
jgi:hypothetical protein